MSADFMTWLTAWLRRHPLQAPPQATQASYTQQVMARVTAPEPAPAFHWIVRPRTAWAVGTVLACGMAFMVVQRQPVRVASELQDAVEVLAEVGELDEVNGNGLEHEAVLADRMMLAEAQAEAEDGLWIEETMKLLNEVEDEDADVKASNGESLEELLRELESLDESEIASS